MVLTFGLSSSAYALTIIWVSDNKNPSGGATADQGWVDLLRAEGYDVDYRGEGGSGDADYRYWRTLDAAKIAELNAADLIIVSRDVSSGGYDDGDEPTQWSSITAPLILQIAHLVRSNDWNWLNSTSTSSTTANMLAVLPSHPVFAGVTLDASKQVNILASGDADVGAVTDAGNGTVIGTRADTGAVWIAEWEPGVEFYAGAGLYTGGPRMWFAGGGVPDGFYNFNAEGEKLFLNAVRYMLGETGGPGQSSDPKPADQATDVPRDTVLSWTPGEYVPAINGHKVYLSENFNDVNDGVGGITQDANSYAPGRLDFGKTYYWRVDEVNGPPDYTVYEGNIWSFMTEPIGYPIENIIATASSVQQTNMGPENTVNGSGLDADDLHSTGEMDMWLSSLVGPQPSWIQYEFDKVYKLHEMWVWNSNQFLEPMVGLGFKDVTIEYSVNGADYITLGTAHEFAQAPGSVDYAHNTTVDFGGVAAKYVRLTANSNWGGLLNQYGLSEVRFFYIPVRAREPSPDSGATDVDVDVTLGFKAGREAAKHDVYLSTDEQAVIDGTAPVATVTETSYGPLSLDLAKTYYWRVDEVNEAETPTTLEGNLWNFSTREYLVVEDFESYNDIPAGEEGSNLVYVVWKDGFDNPSVNGSTIGYTEAFQPSMETSIVYDGKQSVPLFYDNTVAAYSEVTVNVADLQAGQDWAKHGIKALTLHFYGDPNNSVNEQMYIKLNGSKVTYDGDAENLKRIGWQMWYIDLASIGVSLSNVTELSIGFERIGAVGGQGVVLLDGIRLYSYDRQLATPAEPGPPNLVAHWQFEGNANDSSGNGLHGTLMGSPTFVAGKVGQAINLRGVNDYVEITGYKGILGPKAVTVTAWINTTSTETGTIVGWGPSVDGQRFGFRVNENRLRMEISGGNVQGDSNVNDGGWHHVAVTVKENVTISYPDVILYVDGIDDTRPSTDTEAFNLTADQDVRIGSRPASNDRFFMGLIDDVRIYDRALTQEEIAWLAGRAKPFDNPF